MGVIAAPRACRHRAALARILLLTVPLLGAMPGTQMFASAQASAARLPIPAPPSCLGAHDLLIDHGAPTLSSGTYDRICVLNGSVVSLSSGAVLRAGLLYIDGTSAVAADGLAGGRRYGMADCAGFGNGMPAGSPGGAITLLAHTAVILGRISASGGNGANGNDTPCVAGRVDPGGDGGMGGSVTLKAVALTLQGSVRAVGGNGGPGQPEGKGSAGGSVRVETLHPDTAAWTPLITAAPGTDPVSGTPGMAGTVAIGALAAAAQGQLPAPAPPLTQRIGAPPALLPVQSQTVFGAGMQCGAGDLIVPHGAALHVHGVQRYNHVCVAGKVLVDSQLTLLAQTILIAPGAVITAAGVIAQTAPISPTDACGPTHALPQPGAAGAPGEATFGGPGGKGGLAGGTVTLVARRLLFAGTVNVDGTAGGRGTDGGFGSPTSGDIPPAGGGGGGGGGSVSLVAHDLQVTGTFSTRGGSGGPQGVPANPPAGYLPPLGQRGVAGCTRIAADTLRAASGALNVPGTLYFGHSLPVDPVVSTGAAGVQYSTATLHTVSGPFLSFWQAHNGLAVFGEPLSEPFVDGGLTVQYFERARLTVSGGAVSISPLGVLLTSGRSFPAVPSFPGTATDQYFPATSHSLSGRFLTYWQAHAGALLFGPPISEPLMETNGDGTGRVYLVQYFRNARMEYHPELKGTRFEVSLGALGRDYLHQLGWL